jgi:signal transduction histidine kinase
VLSAVGGWIAGIVFVALLLAVVSMVVELLERQAFDVEETGRRLEDLVVSKDELIGVISHEISTPLTGILAFAADLDDESDPLDAEQRRELAGHIAGLATEIEHVTDDLVVTARTDIGTLVTRRESVELKDEIRQFLDHLALGPGGIEITGESCRVEVDRLRLRQILRNLVNDAIARGGGHVWMEVSGVPGGGVVRVCDDGDGIPAVTDDPMLSPDEQAQRKEMEATAPRRGLAIARRLAETMDGTVAYRRSTGTSIVELTLPAARPAARPVERPAAPSTTLLRGGILSPPRTSRAAERVRNEVGRGWNRLRLGSTGSAVALTLVMGMLGFRLAWILIGVVSMSVIHGFFTRDHSEVSLALALDLTVVFVTFSLAAVPVATLSIAYLTFGVVVILLCDTIAKAALGVLASALFVASVYVRIPGTEDIVGSVWSRVSGWSAAIIFILLLLGMVRASIDLLQRYVGEADEANRRLAGEVAAKDDLIAAISHEIRTPLAGVLGFAAELAEQWDVYEAEERREMVGDILALSRSLEDISEDLKVAAKSDLSTLVLRAESLELYGEILEFAERCRHAPGGFEVIGEPCEVEADRLRLRQILRGLVSNAVAHGGDHVWMEVATVPDGGAVRVCDDGDGIPDEYREQIFAPYERLHRHPTLAAATGLGLAIARGLSEAMGGTLTYRRVDSTTVFELILPHAQAPVASTGGASTAVGTMPAVAQVPDAVLPWKPVVAARAERARRLA